VPTVPSRPTIFPAHHCAHIVLPPFDEGTRISHAGNFRSRRARAIDVSAIDRSTRRCQEMLKRSSRHVNRIGSSQPMEGA